MGRNATTTPNRTSETRATIRFIGSLASPHESCGLACYRSDSTIFMVESVITSGLGPTKSALFLFPYMVQEQSFTLSRSHRMQCEAHPAHPLSAGPAHIYLHTHG